MQAPLFPAASFGDLRARLADLPAADPTSIAAARVRQDNLTKPPGALGRLEELAIFMAGWQGRARPVLDRAQAVVFAGNHGICRQGVNPFPQEVTAQMVANFTRGGAAINQLCRVSGADLSIVALDLDRPTGDFTEGPAMTEAEVLDAMVRGAAAVDTGANVLLLGEMGTGSGARLSAPSPRRTNSGAWPGRTSANSTTRRRSARQSAITP